MCYLLLDGGPEFEGELNHAIPGYNEPSNVLTFGL
jgi:hypothetical protein